MQVTIHRPGPLTDPPEYDPTTGEHLREADTTHTAEAERVGPTAGREISEGQQTHIVQALGVLNPNADVEMQDRLEANGVLYEVVSVLPVLNIWETATDHLRVDLRAIR